MLLAEIEYPLLLDGGLSNQLESQGCDLNNPMWTADLLKSNPEAIIQAHLTYLEAGARCIITSSYQATIAGFKKRGISNREGRQLILHSVELANEAIKRFRQVNNHVKPLIAGSVGPYGAFLADGSEYKGDYGLTLEELIDFHLPRISLLDASGVDLLACETIPSYLEACALNSLLDKCQKPAWLSFSCKDGEHVCDGTPIVQCISMLNANEKILGVGVNCTAPRFISDLIRKIKSVAQNKKIVVYPNSGELYEANGKIWTSPAGDILNDALFEEWLQLGTDIIGGCCRVGPEQIKSINRLKQLRR